MPQRFTIQVTQHEIDKAKPKESGLCMAAMAIARTIPDAHHVDVDLRTVRFTLDDERHVYLTPYAVSGYVIGYDAGDEIHPFTFQLREDARVPTRSKKLTPAGTAKNQAKNKDMRARQKLAKTEAKLFETAQVLPPSAPEVKILKQEVKQAKVEALTAEQEREATKAAYVAQRTYEPPAPHEKGTPPPLPKVIKTSKRTYGARVLRVNGGTDNGIG